MESVLWDRLQFAFTAMFHYLFPIVTMGLAPFIAFFIESVFVGALLYGREVLDPRLHAASAFCVWIASWMSGFFIVTANAWMQHPVGYVIGPGGRIELADIGAVLLSPFAWWQFLHVITAALLSGAFVVAGVGAFYLLLGRHEDVARLFVRWGTITALVCSVLVIFPTGDRNGANVTAYQPTKLAAMEGLFESERGAPLAIIGMPDTLHQRLIDPVLVSRLLSFLAYGNFSANVQGLDAYPRSSWPPVALTYYAYHVMVGLGTIFLGIAALGTLLLWRGWLFGARWFLWVLMLALPFPLIANEAGWVSAEVGRQPWIVYGLLRTAQSASTNVVAGETIFTLLGFAGIYLLLLLLYVLVVGREIVRGPR